MAKYVKGILVTFTQSYENELYSSLSYEVNETGYIASINADGTYNVSRGLTILENIPEDHIYSPLGGIDRKVEKHLNDAQKNKEFKDTEGRIGGSAKEKAAFRKIAGQMYTLADVDAMDADPNLAIELIKKEKTLKKPDPVEDMDAGVGAGASFYKQKLYSAFASKPAPNKTFIQAYVALCQYLNEAFKEFIDITKLSEFRNDILNNVIQVVANAINKDIIPLLQQYNQVEVEISALRNHRRELERQLYAEGFTENSDEDVSVKLRSLIDEINLNVRNLNNKFDDIKKHIIKTLLPDLDYRPMYSSDFFRDYSNRLLLEISGKSFVNFLARNSTAAEEKYQEALSLEPISEENYIANYKPEITRRKEQIERLSNYIEKAKNLKSYEDFEGFFNNPDYKEVYQLSFIGGFPQSLGRRSVEYKDLKTIEHKIRFRDVFIEVYEKRVQTFKKELEAYEKKYHVKPANWSWIESKSKKATDQPERKKAEIKINTYPPLESIERKGGLEIDEELINEQKIVDVFGFKTVQFGQSLKDIEAKAHIKHFLGAVSDFADILDIDITQLNKIGGLSIAFAARGKGRATAHYEPLYKIINLTKVRGGGALAHEYLHYIDNLLPFFKNEGSQNPYNTYGSVENRYGFNVNDDRVNRALKNIFAFIYRGIFTNPDGTQSQNDSEISVTIDASNRGFKLPKSFFDREVKGSVVPKTIEEYLEYFRKIYTQYIYYDNLSNRDIDVLGAIVGMFGMENYVMTFKSKTSRFYSNSKKMSSDYWSRPYELFARGFETYIYDKLNQFGRCNTYLVSGVYFDSEIGVYPQGDEREKLFVLYDRFIDVLKQFLELKPFTPFTDTRVNEFIDLSGEKEKVEGEVEVELESGKKDTDPAEKEYQQQKLYGQIISSYGETTLEGFKKYLAYHPEMDLTRIFETAFDIQEFEGVQKPESRFFFEAMFYEIARLEDFKDLKGTIAKGGMENNHENVKRMIDVGVELPQSILSQYNDYFNISPSKTPNEKIKQTLKKLSALLSKKMARGGKIDNDFSPLENLKNKIINL